MSSNIVEVYYQLSAPVTKPTKPNHDHSYTCPAVKVQVVKPLFQIRDYALALYGSIGKTEFDPSMGELISENYTPDMRCMAFDILNHRSTGISLPIPVKKQTYYAVTASVSEIPKAIRLMAQRRDAVFDLSDIAMYGEPGVPDLILHKFELVQRKRNILDSVHWNGAPVIDLKGNFYGVSLQQDDGLLSVIPSKIVMQFVSDFVSFESQPEKYVGLIKPPFQYELANGRCLISSNCRVPVSETCTKLIKKGAQIQAINGLPIVTRNGVARVMDPDFGRHVDIDMYVRTTFDSMTPFTLTLSRDSKTLDIDVFGLPREEKLTGSDTLSYNPSGMFPHINYKGLIMVQLTHELLSIFETMDKNIDNELIRKACLDAPLIPLYPAVIIVDTLDADLAYHNNLPQMQHNSKKKFDCPLVHKIDGTDVHTLADVQKLLNATPTNTILYSCSMDLKPGCGTALEL
ncbi:Hypothetical protein MVR_LOCUS4 [uncultured virus]|nr:Hypothetical protein MVR_LOCUS4 [uncultured virus]